MISGSFLYRARCKYCAGTPQYHSFNLDKLILRNLRLFLDLKHNYMKKDFLIKEPFVYGKNGKKAQLKSISFNTLDVSAHKNYNSVLGYRIKECLICSCGGTLWAYADSPNYNRKHIYNRKCKYLMPNSIF